MVSYLSRFVKMGPIPLAAYVINMEMSRWAAWELGKAIYKKHWKKEGDTQENYKKCGWHATNALVMHVVTRLKYGNVLALAGLISINRWKDNSISMRPVPSLEGSAGAYSKNYYTVSFLDTGVTYLAKLGPKELPNALKKVGEGSLGALTKVEAFLTDCRYEIAQVCLLAVLGISFFQGITGRLPTHLSYGGYRLL